MPLSSMQLIALMNIPRIGKKTAAKLSQNFESVPSNDEFIERLSSKDRVIKNQITKDNLISGLSHAKEVLEKSESLGIKSLNIYDEKYPNCLRYAFSENGQTGITPPVIFFKGNIELLEKDCLLIIGSRNCKEYAKKAALYLSENFATRNFTIVSGLAKGCDTAVHEGAIKTGKTIAVVGNGLDIVYPKENKELATKILETGGLIFSEYELGTPASKYTLVARDLLQTAVSNAVIVVQTAENGGSMHAAVTAFNSGKKVYTVQFSDKSFNNSDECSGNNILVSKYGASYIKATADKKEMNTYLDIIAKQIKGENLWNKIIYHGI